MVVEAARPGTEAATAEEERHVAGVDPLLDPVALRLRQPACLDGRVDAVLQGLLQRGGQRARLDAELLRSVVQDGLAFLPGREHPGGRDGGARAGDDQERHGAGDQEASAAHVRQS